MDKKLTKTFLSLKKSGLPLFVGFFSLFMLLFFFSLNHSDLSANGFLVFEKGQYWRAFTTTLLHGDLNHLAHNAFFFTALSALLFSYFGFWIYPVLSLVAGALINIITLKFYPPEVHLVGISGVIYFMASFWLTLYILIEKRQSLVVRLVHAVAVLLIFFFPESFQIQTSYLAHGVGFLFGIPFALMYYFLNAKKIKAQEVWTTIIPTARDIEMESIILLEESSYHQLPLEEAVLCEHASDSAQCLKH